jgi:hypothetical protein
MTDIDINLEYLSDEDLEKLIMDMENETQVQAPSYIDRKVLSVIETGERRKILSFRLYCARVGFAVAVAILFVCIVPFVPNLKANILSNENVVAEEPLVSKEDVLASRPIKTREEVLKEMNDPDYLEKTEESIRSYIDDLLK